MATQTGPGAHVMHVKHSLVPFQACVPFYYLPLDKRAHRPERERESKLPGQNSHELQPQHHIRRNTSFQREAATEGLLHTNLGYNIHKLQKSFHTKLLIPSIFHRKSLSLWPNHILTQLLTNHGCFRSYLHKIKKAPTPLCSCPEKVEQTA